jgi:hypothetical protein
MLFRLGATTTSADSRGSRRRSLNKARERSEHQPQRRAVCRRRWRNNAFPFRQLRRRRRQPSEHRSERSEQSKQARCASSSKKGITVARRQSKHLRPARPLSSGHATSVIKSDGRWIVRSVPGSAATKAYRCPGCNAEIRPGTPHIVAWADAPGLLSESAVDERRHWHTGCWQRRP